MQRIALLGLGQTEAPLTALGELVRTGADPLLRAAAAAELAGWHQRRPGAEAARLALEHLDCALALRGPTGPLVIGRILLLSRLGRLSEADEAFHAAALAGLCTPDLLLARAAAETGAEGRCCWINLALARRGLAALRLEPGSAPPLDRLLADRSLAPETAPLVSVLVATYRAAATIGTALRSLMRQSWQALEILVIDDASPDATCAQVAALAAQDSRIRLIRQPVNRGAYAARNTGLRAARGDFVTLHDADDWAHPARIETQMRHLLARPEALACLSEHVRLGADLRPGRQRSNGGFILPNLSSCLFRRQPVLESLGGWDEVRFGADDEFLHRLRLCFGAGALDSLPTGPLVLARDRPDSATASPETGLDFVLFGARREYNTAFHRHFRRGGPLNYSRLTGRPFPVPRPMLPDPAAVDPDCDLVIQGDFRLEGAALDDLLARITAARAGGLRIGLLEVPDPARSAPGIDTLPEALRALIDGDGLRVLVFGERLRAQRVLDLGNGGPPADNRYLARVESAEEGLSIGVLPG